MFLKCHQRPGYGWGYPPERSISFESLSPLLFKRRLLQGALTRIILIITIPGQLWVHLLRRSQLSSRSDSKMRWRWRSHCCDSCPKPELLPSRTLRLFKDWDLQRWIISAGTVSKIDLFTLVFLSLERRAAIHFLRHIERPVLEARAFHC